MLKRSASRIQKSKGVVRAKQILQILLLLGICFWLVYQVKYSHDQKKVIVDEKDVSRISQKGKDDNHDLKFGRKELHPRYDEQNEEEAEEVKEGEEVEEKKAHEEVESEEGEEEEEVKKDEPENHETHQEVEEEEEEEEVKELEDREQERPRDEGDDRGEEFIDEEKEKEEDNDEEVKIEQVEDETEGNTNNVEEDDQDRAAQEEHYKGDDASSAVTHETEIDIVETEDKSSVPEIIEMPESLNGTNSADANTTEFVNSSPTEETAMGNATVVNSNTTLTESEEALTYQPTSEDSSLVKSDSYLRLPSSTTESKETNTQDEPAVVITD